MVVGNNVIEHKSNYPNGSMGTLFVVVVVIAMLGLLAGLLARLCNGRHRVGNLDYDFEGWVEKKCASCIDGSLDPPPLATASPHWLSNIASVLPAPPHNGVPHHQPPFAAPPPPPNGVPHHQPPPSLVQIEIADGAGGAPPPPHPGALPSYASAPAALSAGPMLPSSAPTTTPAGSTSTKKKKKRKSGGGGAGGVGAPGAGGGGGNIMPHS
ncbi:hypothetical protein L7F22_056633 [Adiantum nelumboides]|nr:hypothetical protein [Adiantum nelumboides]